MAFPYLRQPPVTQAQVLPFLRSMYESWRRLNTPEVEFMVLEELNTEPTRLIDGVVARADGTNWNPGSGRGVYWYDITSSTWKFMG